MFELGAAPQEFDAPHEQSAESAIHPAWHSAENESRFQRWHLVFMKSWALPQATDWVSCLWR